MKKEHILKSNEEFQRIIKSYRPYKYNDFILYIEKTKSSSYFFGFSVGKKIGNAVTRNKIKRQLKSIVSKKDYQSGFNCIIIVGRGILDKDYQSIETSLLKSFKINNLLKGEINE